MQNDSNITIQQGTMYTFKSVDGNFTCQAQWDGSQFILYGKPDSFIVTDQVQDTNTNTATNYSGVGQNG